MNELWHNHIEWFLENMSLCKIAESVGTPCYVYSKKTIVNNLISFNESFGDYPHKIHYAVKANSNLAILNILKEYGAGFDIVSIGELHRVLAIGCISDKVIFSGVGKTKNEIECALRAGIGCINIESESELLRLNIIAISLSIKANIAIRVNPDINSNSHPYIATGLKDTKFGVGFSEAIELYKIAISLPGIKIKGISFHIGSQIISLDPFIQAIDKILELNNFLKSYNINLEHINVGGGLGICYSNEVVPTIQQYVEVLVNKLKHTGLIIYIEPGRSIVADAGVLLTKVEYIKKIQNNKYFAIVDAGMNDLYRPALYNSWHDILPVKLPHNRVVASNYFDVVGPVCESSDFLGKNRYLALNQDDLLMICAVGAYGFSMSSNYNSRPRCAEIMVNNNEFKLIRKREALSELFKSERI